MNLNPQSPFASKASQLLSWGHWFTFANIALVLLISLGYLWADSAPTTWLGRFYMVVTWLSHTSFITFLAFVLTVFPLSLVFPYPRHIRGMAAVIATLGLSWLCLDAFVYYQLGYHINFSSLSEILSVFVQTLSARPIFVSAIATLIIGAFFAFELVISNFAWKHLAELKQLKFPSYAAVCIVSCFAASHSIHIWADANSYFDITKQDNVLPMSYPTTAKSLLAKHNLIDIDQYKKSTQIDLDSKNIEFVTPELTGSCSAVDKPTTQILVFANNAQLLEFVGSNDTLKPFSTLLHPTSIEDSLFNVIYGLPAIYKRSMIDEERSPAWAKGGLLSVHGFPEFKYIPERQDAKIVIQFVNGNTLNIETTSPVIALSFANDEKSVVATSTFYSNIKAFKKAEGLIQPMDLLATVLSQVINCEERAAKSTLGHTVTSPESSHGVNHSQGVFIAFKKDRITLIKPDGSYQQMSAAEGFVIEQKLDIPFLIQSIKQLKQFGPSTSQ
ncbi:DUF3413 domain-containing protein [Pseudoalteromonas xiamenensis]